MPDITPQPPPFPVIIWHPSHIPQLHAEHGKWLLLHIPATWDLQANFFENISKWSLFHTLDLFSQIIHLRQIHWENKSVGGSWRMQQMDQQFILEVNAWETILPCHSTYHCAHQQCLQLPIPTILTFYFLACEIPTFLQVRHSGVSLLFWSVNSLDQAYLYSNLKYINGTHSLTKMVNILHIILLSLLLCCNLISTGFSIAI